MAHLKEGSIIKKSVGDEIIATLNDVPTALSQLNQDESNRLVTDIEKNTWNNKQNALGYTAENTSNKGSANGYAGLDNTGKIPASQLPSFVDDVVEVSSLSGQGETGKIYVLTTNNKTYRWSGSQYVEISESLALGETSSTAYPGNKGLELEQKLAQKIDVIEIGYDDYQNLTTKEPNVLYLVSR